jgi:GxxExxY protein
MNKEIVYKELSYQLIGFGYQVFNELGFGLEEKVYAKAYEELLLSNHIAYKKENYCSIKINDKMIAKNFFDFLIEKKIVIELKVGDKNYKNVCEQLYKYLRVGNLKLGIVIRFMRDGVRVKRIVNLYDDL